MSRSVLVADDSPLARAMLREQLEAQGYVVSEAADGEEAVRACAEVRPDVVLLDIEMPGLDGHGALARIKADPAIASTPVVFLSARVRTEDVVEGLRLGAHDYLGKPFEPAELIARVRAAVRVKELQDDLLDKAAELQRSNADLEQFARAASHDLQEPLRMVSAYAQLLAQAYRGRLDATADEYIEFAVDAVTRMQALIKALLEYSRAGQAALEPSAVDVGGCVEASCRNLAMAIAESGARVDHDGLPSVWGDAGQITQLFQNLIGNAIKFRGEAAPRIVITATHEGADPEGDWVFSVHDNGMGLPPEQATRIFEPFRRLHSRDEIPGTGLGLALCRKVVERLGGRIWVESSPGAGSDFRFTVPSLERARPPG